MVGREGHPTASIWVTDLIGSGKSDATSQSTRGWPYSTRTSTVAS